MKGKKSIFFTFRSNLIYCVSSGQEKAIKNSHAAFSRISDLHLYHVTLTDLQFAGPHAHTVPKWQHISLTQFVECFCL